MSTWPQDEPCLMGHPTGPLDLGDIVHCSGPKGPCTDRYLVLASHDNVTWTSIDVVCIGSNEADVDVGSRSRCRVDSRSSAWHLASQRSQRGL